MSDLDQRLAAAMRLHTAWSSLAATSTSTSRVLFDLAAAIPYDHAMLSRWDPRAGRFTTAASLGYRSDVTEVINEWMPRHPVFDDLRRAPTPALLDDVPTTLRYGPIFEQVIAGQRYSDGMTICLHGTDGVPVGMLNLSTTDGRRFDRDAVVSVAFLAGHLAVALPRPAASDSECVPAELLAPGTAGHAVVERFRAHTVDATEYLFVRETDLLRVTLRRGRGRGGDGVETRCRPAEPPLRLTHREIQVFALLPSGATNRQIAALLSIGPTTVATHLERILAKSHAINRTAAAAEAVRLGLVPAWRR